MHAGDVKKIARFALRVAHGGMVHLPSEWAVPVRKFTLWESGLGEGSSPPHQGWLPGKAAQGLFHPRVATASGAPPFPSCPTGI
jgi:hypothetical protein